MDDEALLDRARSGDREAFTAIVDRYQDELYTMAVRTLGDRTEAADVVQEAFLRAYLNLPRVRGSIRAWLFRVTINAAHDIHRRRRRRPADPLEDSEGNVIELPDTAATPHELAEERERAELVRGALERLPEDFRTIVVLRDVSQLSYDEISEALGIPEGTVKSRLSRARGSLAELLRGTAAAPSRSEEA